MIFFTFFFHKQLYQWVTQSRKRVYLVGYLDRRCAGKILPFPTENGTPLIQIRTGSQGKRVYSPQGLSCTLTSLAGGMGGKTGLYEMGVPIKENTKQGYKMAYPGDSIDLGYAGMNTRRGSVGHQIAHTPVSYTHLDVYKRQVINNK